MGPKERREREREDTRTAIIDAARELFVTQGYDAVTMRGIAEKIEYTPTAIYFHFKDKESVIRAVCDSDFGALAHKFEKIARIPDPIDRLRKAGHAYITFGLENPFHYRLMFMTPHPPMKEDESELRKGNPEDDAYAFLVSIITEAIEKRRFRKNLRDPQLVSQLVWAGVHGVISLEIAKCHDDGIDWRPMKKRASLMVDVLIDGLQAEKD